MSVFRLSVSDAEISVETWADWAGFDATLPPARGVWSDLADSIQAPDPDAPRAEGVFELQRIRAQNGLLTDAAKLVAQDARAWTAAGAAVIGAFRVVHGDDLPACLLLLRWPSLAVALDAQSRVEQDAVAIEARRLSREARGIATIRGCRRLFRPALAFT